MCKPTLYDYICDAQLLDTSFHSRASSDDLESKCIHSTEQICSAIFFQRPAFSRTRSGGGFTKPLRLTKAGLSD